MIERVAKAINESYSASSETFNGEELARMAITAMREPTDKMILGWQDAQTCRDTYFDNDCYKAMIDAALKEE